MNPVTGNGTPPPTSAEEETPMQRDRARTIFERSAPGRRAATLPEAGVPEPPLEKLIPKRCCASAPPSLPEVAEPEIVRHHAHLPPQLRPGPRLLPARLLHDGTTRG